MTSQGFCIYFWLITNGAARPCLFPIHPVKKKPSCPVSLTNVLTDHPVSLYWRIRSILCLPKHSHPTKDLCLTKVPETKNQNMPLKGKVCRMRGIHLPCPVCFWKISRALHVLLWLMRSVCTSPYIQFHSSSQVVKAAVSRGVRVLVTPFPLAQFIYIFFQFSFLRRSFPSMWLCHRKTVSNLKAIALYQRREKKETRALLYPNVGVNIPKVWTSRLPGDDRGSEMVPTALCSKWKVCFSGLCPQQVFADIEPLHLSYHCMLTRPYVTVYGLLYLSHGKFVFQVDKIWCKMSHDSLILPTQ